MRTAWLMAGAVTVLGACASNGPATGPETSPARAAACETTTERVYFAPELQDLPAEAAPILRAVMERVHECEAAGGTLQGLNVVAFPDSSETGPDADDLARERAGEVREALIALGAPAAKVQTISHRDVPEDPNRVLRRHATIGIVMN